MRKTICLLFATVAAVSLFVAAATAAERQTTLTELGRTLKLDPARISVSGVSSGGFMAHQFHVAHSKTIIGAGIMAGGPYACTKGDVMRGLTVCTAFLADGFCQGYDGCNQIAYAGPGPATAGQAASPEAMAMAQQSADATFTAGQNATIDDPSGIIGDKVVILHGVKDSLLRVGVSDALAQYFPALYQRTGSALPEGTVVYLKDVPAPHAVVTDNHVGLDPERGQVNACNRFGSPFVNACGQNDCAAGCKQACETAATPGECDTACDLSCGIALDNAGRILSHIYGPLQPRPDPSLIGVKQYDPHLWPTVSHDCKAGEVTDSRCQWLRRRLFAFPQKEMFGNSALATEDAVMAEKGYVFVPPQCLDGTARCKLHVAFHGCRQGFGFTGIEPDGQPVKKALYGARATEEEQQLRGWTYFIENAGYNEWADTNDVVVLYPQATTNSNTILQHMNPMGCWDFWGYTNQDFNTRTGLQIAAVWRMIQALAP
jgi:poly(3-hydroxybutyrate) depolymerase